MVVAIVYIFANAMPKIYEPMASRFTQKYLEHPPGETDHELIVVVNGGGPISERQRRLFDPLVPTFLYHDNSAKDLGAYFMVARTVPCDFMMCIGGPVRPRIAGWLDAFVQATENFGPGVFGPWGAEVPAVHIRTTVFSISTELLNAYPYPTTNDTRYNFEHGFDNIALWCSRMGFSAMQVTRRGAFPIKDFHHVEEADSYFWDQHCHHLKWKDE